MNKLNLNKISLKLLVVCISFSLPIAVMLNSMVNAKQKDINFADWERKGNQIQRPLERLLKGVSLHRWTTLRISQGEQDLKSKQLELASQIGQNIKSIQETLGKIGDDLQFTADGLGKRSRSEFTGDKLADKWRALSQDARNLSFDKLDSAYLDLINHIKVMITHAGDTSNLILDPDLDSYYLMDVTLLALPQTQDRLQNIALYVEKLVNQGSMSDEERLKVSVFHAFLKEADLDRINASSQTSLNEDSNFYGISTTLQKNLKLGMSKNTNAVDPVLADLKQLASLKNVSSFNIDSFRANIEDAISESYKFHEMAFDELDNLLQTRIQHFKVGVRNSIAMTFFAILISCLLAFAIVRSIVLRVRKFKDITHIISEGDLSARVNMQNTDEIGQLARSFDSMTGQIHKLTLDIESKNKQLQGINESLEGIVAERTATIKTILDNVKFGFLLVNKDLQIEDGFSRSCTDLLGKNLKVGASFLDVVGLSDSRHGNLANEFIKQAFEDFLPEEMTLHQLPTRIQKGERILSLASSTVRDQANNVKSLLFTIIDCTSLEKAENESNRHKLLVRLLKEIDAFKDFLADSHTRIESARLAIASRSEERLRNELHTLKGNSAAFDLLAIAHLIHEIEEVSDISISDIDRIESAFIGFLDDNFDILQVLWKSDSHESYSVSRFDLETVVERVRQSLGTDHLAADELANWAIAVQYKTARSLVGALPEYGERLASRLGKSCRIRVEGGDTKMDPEIMRPIVQSLVHLVRNSIDHGIEFPIDRGSKPEAGTISISCGESQYSWTIEITDDGSGINTQVLTQKAISNGLVSAKDVIKMSEKQKYRLVFLSGLSTADTVSDISGRGVGMSAIEASVKDADGDLDIDSTPGLGTKITITIPKLRRQLMRSVKVA
jgi:HAMP domain-containing protein/signal transduction histidine kinase